MAARGTVGRVAANLSESNRMKDWAARSRIGARTLKMTSGIASGSFDARGIKIVGKGLADTGLKNLGKAQVGGFTKVRADAVKKEEDFANKLLDTSDKGKAELTRGGMDAQQADAIQAQLIRGGMDAQTAAGHRTSLVNSGINVADVNNVTRYLDAARRNDRASILEGRQGGVILITTPQMVAAAAQTQQAQQATQAATQATQAATQATCGDTGCVNS